jgi:hypothetical protein
VGQHVAGEESVTDLYVRAAWELRQHMAAETDGGLECVSCGGTTRAWRCDECEDEREAIVQDNGVVRCATCGGVAMIAVDPIEHREGCRIATLLAELEAAERSADAIRARVLLDCAAWLRLKASNRRSLNVAPDEEAAKADRALRELHATSSPGGATRQAVELAQEVITRLQCERHTEVAAELEVEADALERQARAAMGAVIHDADCSGERNGTGGRPL